MLGAADALLADLDLQFVAVDRACHAQTTAGVRARLGPTAFASAHRLGAGLSMEAVLALVEAEPALAQP